MLVFQIITLKVNYQPSSNLHIKYSENEKLRQQFRWGITPPKLLFFSKYIKNKFTKVKEKSVAKLSELFNSYCVELKQFKFQLIFFE